MKVYELKPSAAETASATGSTVEITQDEDRYSTVLLDFDLTAAATETGDTLDVFVDFSYDGENWLNVAHFTQAAGDGGTAHEVAKITAGELNDPDAVLDVSSDAAAAVVRNLGVMPYMRYRSTINDATTEGNVSFTYSVHAVLL